MCHNYAGLPLSLSYPVAGANCQISKELNYMPHIFFVHMHRSEIIIIIKTNGSKMFLDSYVTKQQDLIQHDLRIYFIHISMCIFVELFKFLLELRRLPSQVRCHNSALGGA